MRKIIVSLLLICLVMLSSALPAFAAEDIGYAYIYPEGEEYIVCTDKQAYDIYTQEAVASRAFVRKVVDPEYDVLGITKKNYASNPRLKNLNEIGEYFLYALLTESFTASFTYAKKITDDNLVLLLNNCTTYFPQMIACTLRWKKNKNGIYAYEISFKIDRTTWEIEKKYARKFAQNNSASAKDEKEYLLLAHDKIAKLATYDYAVQGLSREQLEKKYGHYHGQLGYCVFTCRKSVCSGYANLLSLMGMCAAINVPTVPGYAKRPHRWNWVLPKKGEPVLIDITWDDTYYSPTGEGELIHTYFWNENLLAGSRSVQKETRDFIEYLNENN